MIKKVHAFGGVECECCQELTEEVGVEAVASHHALIQ